MFKVSWIRKNDNALVASSTLSWLPKTGEAVYFEGNPAIYRVHDIMYKVLSGSFANTDVIIILSERSPA